VVGPGQGKDDSKAPGRHTDGGHSQTWSPQKVPSYPAAVLSDLLLEVVYGSPVDVRVKSRFPGLVGNKPVELVACDILMTQETGCH